MSVESMQGSCHPAALAYIYFSLCGKETCWQEKRELILFSNLPKSPLTIVGRKTKGHAVERKATSTRHHKASNFSLFFFLLLLLFSVFVLTWCFPRIKAFFMIIPSLFYRIVVCHTHHSDLFI